MYRAALIQLALWTAFAQAFFPYFPKYACSEYHGCGEQDERDLPAEELRASPAKDSDPVTLNLVQRISPVSTTACQPLGPS